MNKKRTWKTFGLLAVLSCLLLMGCGERNRRPITANMDLPISPGSVRPRRIRSILPSVPMEASAITAPAENR